MCECSRQARSGGFWSNGLTSTCTLPDSHNCYPPVFFLLFSTTTADAAGDDDGDDDAASDATADDTADAAADDGGGDDGAADDDGGADHDQSLLFFALPVSRIAERSRAERIIRADSTILHLCNVT